MTTPKKKHLIELMIEAGVKWPDGAEYAAQDKCSKIVNFYSKGEPDDVGGGGKQWMANNCEYLEDDGIQLPSLCRNWHQTIVTREQYAEALADTAMTQVAKHEVGEWEPVEWGDWSIGDTVRFDGFTNALHSHWSFSVGCEYIIGNLMAPISAAGQQPVADWGFSFSRRKSAIDTAIESQSNQVRESYGVVACKYADLTSYSSIEQLTSDYHAKAAEADRLQAVADEALKAADDALLALENAGELIGLVISIDTKPKQAEQPEITDWRDLRIGDVIECVDYDSDKEGVIIEIDDEDEEQPIKVERGSCHTTSWPSSWRFIRRP